MKFMLCLYMYKVFLKSESIFICTGTFTYLGNLFFFCLLEAYCETVIAEVAHYRSITRFIGYYLEEL